MKLYHCPLSRSMRILWLANELALDLELVTMPLDLRTLRSPEYLAVHPLGRVPCLVDGDRAIMESGAIAQHLCETHDPEQRLWRPPGHPERAEFLEWLHYAETIAVHGASLNQQRMFIAEPERSPAVQKLESKRLRKALEVVDRRLADREWMLRSGFTAADACVGWSVLLGRAFVGLDGLPGLTAYVERIEARPAFRAAFDNRVLAATTERPAGGDPPAASARP